MFTRVSTRRNIAKVFFATISFISDAMCSNESKPNVKRELAEKGDDVVEILPRRAVTPNGGGFSVTIRDTSELTMRDIVHVKPFLRVGYGTEHANLIGTPHLAANHRAGNGRAAQHEGSAEDRRLGDRHRGHVYADVDAHAKHHRCHR